MIALRNVSEIDGRQANVRRKRGCSFPRVTGPWIPSKQIFGFTLFQHFPVVFLLIRSTMR